MNFESTMAVMPDTLGNILFYTNGCHIANALGDTMPNGAGINPGEMYDWTCPTSGYASSGSRFVKNHDVIYSSKG